MTEQFYLDIAALKQAGTACLEQELHDLDAWVHAQLAPRSGENIMHIGCDSNEQTLSLARTINPDGYVLAIDRSYRALSALSQRCQEGKVEKYVRFLYLDLDDLKGHLRPEDFDRAISGRALYHVKQPQALFLAIRQALKPGGIFFFYGPSRKDLVELRLFHATLRDETRESRALLFIEHVGAPCARDVFPQVEFTRFESPLRFTSPDTLYAYWRESDLYEEMLDGDFRRAAMQHFQSHTTFETAQRLIGVKAING
ncbi:MAG TPA: methyltransferase domain-containing protein [Ktedonobacteraceae bacterium]|jgi:ubiquinone/menaquinone biosynthesis C-methylase UbiE